MEVINANAHMVCDCEVHEFLQQQILECKKRKIGGETNPLYTIAYETGEYLKTTPSAAQDPECIKQFLKEIAKFNLRKAEKIVILNLRPTTEIELNLIIEDAQRFSEEEIEEMLQLIQSVLPEKKVE